MLLPLSVQQEPQKYAPVRTLLLYLTEECNLRCTYCFVKKEPKYMTRETALRTVDYVIQRNISGAEHEVTLAFFGGEPFLAVDRMQEVVDYGQERRPNVYKGFRFAATTNGTLANARVEKVVRQGQMSLLVSVDGGAQASRLRPMVSGRESFSLVRKNLALLASWAPRCTARMTFTPDNLDFLQRVQEVQAIAPVGIALCPVVEADWSGREEALEAAYVELGDWFLKEVRAGRRPPLEITWDLLRDYIRRLECQRRPTRACPLGESLLAVDSQGNVLPCHRFLHRPERLGRVDDAQLPAERWRYVNLQSLEIPDCERCIARTVCGGGCRAVALGAGYGLHGIHPNHCLLMRAHMRQVQRLHQELNSLECFWRFLSGSAPLGALQELLNLGS